MPSDETFDLDYATVDEGSNPSHLLSTMDAVSTWPAIARLRSWERDRLALRDGQRLLDVGCGTGEAAIALAADLGSGGELVGVDLSEAMLRAAQARAAEVPGTVRFALGDAASLDEPDASFDAARSERTLQWVADPARVVAELHRVLRPGGRLALLDTDWSTLILEIGDDQVAAAVRAHVRQERRRPSQVGSQLWTLSHDAGFVELEATAATHVWTRWDPDHTPVPDGFFSIESLADDLVGSGHLAAPDAPHFVESIKDAARRNHFFMALTMFAVAGRRS